jgi:Ca2+-transporting ATPase
MGKRGTQVATEASDVILRDDAFESIVHAVRQGRVIYGNIRAFIRYLFSCNLSEILVLGAATLAGLPLPLLPLQILFLNLVTDVFPALALGFGEGPRDVMRHAPRPRDAPLLGRLGWLGIGLNGVLIAVSVMGAFLIALERTTPAEANTVAFLTLALAQLWFVFALHPRSEPVWSSEITRNTHVWGAIVLSAALALGGVFVPGAGAVLSLAPPAPEAWVTILVASVLPLLAAEGIAAATAAFRGAARGA